MSAARQSCSRPVRRSGARTSCPPTRAYGIPKRFPITEATTQNPVNPYGYTKLVVERMLRDAEAAHGIRYKARELLGWTPNYPDLDQQIAHAWSWFRDKMPNV